MLGLAFVPTVLKAEGLLGYLYRLAGMNGISGDELVEAYRADAEAETHPDAPDHWRIESDELRRPGTSPVRLWAHRAIRCCPRCLAEGAHWRASWHLSLYTCCTRHKLELIDRCPSCSETLTNSTMSTFACDQCWTPLEGAPAIQATANAGALLIARELEERLLYGERTSEKPVGILSLLDFHDVALRLGVRGSPSSRTKPMKPSNIGALSIASPIAAQAGQALFNWPRGFMRLLDSIRTRRKSEQTWQIPRAIGPLYHDLYKALSGSQFDFLRSAFEEYVRDCWHAPVALRNRNLSQDLIENHHWVSRGEAARSLGVDAPLIDYLVASGQMQSREHRYPSGRQARVVDVNLAAPLLERLRQAVTLEQAAERLAIGKTRTRQLAEAGVLMTFGGKPRRGARWWIDPVSLEQFHDTPLLPTPPDTPVLSVAHVARHLAMTQAEFSALAQSIVNGRLRAFSPGGTRIPFGKLLLDEQEIRSWRLSRQRQASGMSVSQAAKELGVKEEVAYALARLGLLRTDTERHGKRKTQTVSDASLKRFRRSYVLAPELAALLKTDPRGMAKRLISAGIKPVAGPRLAGALCRQYVWRRDVTTTSGKFARDLFLAAGRADRCRA